MRTKALACMLAAAIPFAARAGQNDNASLKARLKVLEARVAALEAAGAACTQLVALAPFVKLETGELNGVKGPHVLFTGVNVHVRSGVPATYQDGLRNAPPGPSDGLGNLIVGWNEVRDPSFNEGELATGDRHGSNNLVVGYGHQYKADGGFVAGFLNHLPFRRAASVAGGMWNFAPGFASSVSGGYYNEASGDSASVSGGFSNSATGSHASVSGGQVNEATDTSAAVCGGFHNTASGWKASVSGGQFNTASGEAASVSGGVSNTVSTTAGYAPYP